MEANSWRDVCQSLWVLHTNNLLRASKNGLVEYLPNIKRREEMKRETIRESEGVEAPTVINDKEPGPMSDLEMTDRTMPFL